MFTVAMDLQYGVINDTIHQSALLFDGEGISNLPQTSYTGTSYYSRVVTETWRGNLLLLNEYSPQPLEIRNEQVCVAIGKCMVLLLVVV